MRCLLAHASSFKRGSSMKVCGNERAVLPWDQYTIILKTVLASWAEDTRVPSLQLSAVCFCFSCNSLSRCALLLTLHLCTTPRILPQNDTDHRQIWFKYDSNYKMLKQIVRCYAGVTVVCNPKGCKVKQSWKWMSGYNNMTLYIV